MVSAVLCEGGAQVSDGYTASDIEFAVKQVLTPMRRKQQAYKLLKSTEFVAPLAEREPVFAEEEAQFKEWYSSLLGKKRQAILSGIPDDLGTPAAWAFSPLSFFLSRAASETAKGARATAACVGAFNLACCVRAEDAGAKKEKKGGDKKKKKKKQ